MNKIPVNLPKMEAVPINCDTKVYRGYSSYELALQQGFEGTLDEYLESLKGEQGPKGDSYILTEADKQEIADKVPRTTDYLELENRPIKQLDLTGHKINNPLKLEVCLGENPYRGMYEITGEGFYTLTFMNMTAGGYENINYLNKGALLTLYLKSASNGFCIEKSDKGIYEIEFSDGGYGRRKLLNQAEAEELIKSAVATAKDDLKTKIEYPNGYSFMAENNTEYRYLYPGAAKIQVAVPSASNSTLDFIASLVFRSPETPTEFIYQSDMIFTGDDCEDGVFIPLAGKVYNIVFWYDGYSYNAVARGVSQ